MKKSFNPVLLVIILVYLILYFFSGCSSQNNDNYSSGSSSSTSSYNQTQSIPEVDFNYLNLDITSNIDFTNVTSNFEENLIIRNANLEIETYDFDDDLENILEFVANSNGFVESSSNLTRLNNYDVPFKIYNATIRVPAENYLSVKEFILETGILLFSNDFAIDKTAEYSDISAKLSTKIAEEEKLLEFLETAEFLEDIIDIEERLAIVRADIEIFRYHLNDIDYLANFSTIGLSILEIPTSVLNFSSSKDFGGRIKNGFINSFNNTYYFLENTLLFIVRLFVPIVLILVFSFIYKKVKKSKKFNKV